MAYKKGIIAIPNVTGDISFVVHTAVDSRIPAEYTEVEWIGAGENGDIYTHCINPNLTWQDFDKIEFIGFRDEYNGYAGSSGIMLLATWTGTNTRTSPYIAFRDPILFSGISGTISTSYTKSQLRESGFKNFTITLTSHTATGQVEFGSWTDAGFGSHWRTKEQKWYNGTNLVRHLIPCFRKSDNAAGMYDIVGNVFYANAGGGTLIYNS